MKRILKHILLLPVTVILCNTVSADVGRTHELRRERAELLEEIETLRTFRADTIPTYIEGLNRQLLSLDEQLFNSYQQTVDRMVELQAERTTDNRLLVALALGSCVLAILFSVLVFMARSRILDKENTGLRGIYRQLMADFMQQVSPEQAGENRLLRVNAVVILGLVMMSVSILAFLIGSV